MSIETEFESTITNVQNAYQGLDNLGATIPENKTIENIKSCLDEIYAKFPKTDYAEGSNITLSNTLKGKLDFEDGIVGIGDTKQNSYEGYNLANCNGMNSLTHNGITFTINKDSNGSVTSIKLNGTCTNYNALCIGTAYTLKAGTYTLYGNGITNNIILQILNDTADSQIEYVAKDNRTLTLNADTNIILRLSISVGATLNNVEIYPMIATTSGKSFEPYVGGTASPNPSYPQDIEVVRGKNRLKPITIDRTIKGVKITSNDNGKITIKGTATDSINEPIWGSWGGSNVLCELPQGSYVSSGSGTNSPRINIVANGTTTIFTGNSTRTLTNTAKITGIFLYINNGESVDMTFEPMIEPGSQATSYLPYNTLEVVERGKNLLNTANGSVAYKPEGTTITIDSNGVINASADMNYASINIPSITLKAGTTYTFKRSFTGSYNSLLVDTNGNNVIGIGYNKTSVTATIESDVTINKLNGALLSGDNYFQLETGSTATDYEPYQTPKTYQLSLGEYEFAKIGNYVDTIEYDVDEDKVYKNENVNKVVFNGSETWSFVNLSDRKRSYISVADIVTTIEDSDITPMLCTNFINTSYSLGQGVGQPLNVITGRKGIAQINIFHNIADNNTDFKAWLSNNQPIAYYPLAETIKIPITTTLKDQIKALYNSQSFTGTTIIEINGQLPLIIKVRALKGN